MVRNKSEFIGDWPVQAKVNECISANALVEEQISP